VRTAGYVIAYNLLRIETWLIVTRLVLLWTPLSLESRTMRFLAFVVEPVLRPIRRHLPRVGGMDLSPIVALVLLVQVAAMIRNVGDGLYATPAALAVAIGGRIVLDVLGALFILMALRVFLTLTGASSHNPATKLVQRVSSPVVRHVERVVTPVRSLDVPAAVVGIVCLVLYAVLSRVLIATLGVPL
jgi:YggT family protein